MISILVIAKISAWFFFTYLPPEFLPVSGLLTQWCAFTLAQPCCVALGRALDLGLFILAPNTFVLLRPFHLIALIGTLLSCYDKHNKPWWSLWSKNFEIGQILNFLWIFALIHKISACCFRFVFVLRERSHSDASSIIHCTLCGSWVSKILFANNFLSLIYLVSFDQDESLDIYVTPLPFF